VQIAHEIAGAACTRHSLRPLFSEGECLLAELGRNVPRDREHVSGCHRRPDRLDPVSRRRRW